MCRLAFLITVLFGLAMPVSAQDGPDRSGAMAGLLEALPDSTLRKQRRNPERFVEDAASLILGYGEDARIGPDGIDRYVAVRRAYVRAREMRKLLLGDLNDDLAISESEIALLIDTASAPSRGRLLLEYRAGDLDRNGRLDFSEMRAFVRERSLAEISDWDAKDWMALMEFDTNGDGFVSLEEVVVTARAFDYEA